MLQKKKAAALLRESIYFILCYFLTLSAWGFHFIYLFHCPFVVGRNILRKINEKKKQNKLLLFVLLPEGETRG